MRRVSGAGCKCRRRAASASPDGRNEVPQAEQLEAEMYSLPVLELEVPNQCVGRALPPLKPPGEDSSLPLPSF